MNRRAVLLVCDGLGVGAAPDADVYGDAGSDTLRHVLEACRPRLPNLERLGLLRLAGGGGGTGGSWASMREISAGKDSMAGHWEMMGLPTRTPFPLYPNGFPDEVVRPFERAIGRRVLGNRPASGTEILKDLGAEHLATGSPILYTSGDSVFQLAAHERAVPVELLREWCLTARRMLVPPHGVGRVIARPFRGEPGAFVRTAGRRDYPMEPPGPTLLDRAVASGRRTFGIGKIGDIFAGRGLSGSVHTSSDAEGVERTIERLRSSSDDLIFTNLVDFDSKYGHRGDSAGFARNLESLDERLPVLLDALNPGDLLLLTGDHGCDPTDASTDHTRERVPLVAAGAAVARGIDLGERRSFCDVSATVAEWLEMPPEPLGESLAPRLFA